MAVDFVRVDGVAGEESAVAWAEVYGTRQEEFRPSILLRLRELLLTHALPAAFFGILCGVKALLAPDRDRLTALIQRKHPFAPVDVAAQIPGLPAL